MKACDLSIDERYVNTFGRVVVGCHSKDSSLADNRSSLTLCCSGSEWTGRCQGRRREYDGGLGQTTHREFRQRRVALTNEKELVRITQWLYS